MAPKIVFDFSFENGDADLILLSGDCDLQDVVEFHVHKAVLAEASSFFSCMFSGPRAQDESEDLDSGYESEKGSANYSIPQAKRARLEHTSIPVPENDNILNILLHYSYPKLLSPSLRDVSLRELSLLIDAAIKYDFTYAIDTLRQVLVSPQRLEMDPLAIYAIACQFELEEAGIAAARCTELDLIGTLERGEPLHPSIKNLSAYDYHRLLSLQLRTCQMVALLFSDLPEGVTCMHCSSSDGTPKWWAIWVQQVGVVLGRCPSMDKVDQAFEDHMLYHCARRSGCSGCVESTSNSWIRLQELKQRVAEVLRERQHWL